jgi:hypothetical protein
MMLAVAELGPRMVIVLGWATILVLLVVRRFRHLFVFLGAFYLVQELAWYLATGILDVASPLRPAGIAVLGLAGPSAYPLAPVAALTARLVGMLYALIPQGRIRQVGKAVAAAIVAVVALARMYLAIDTPTGVLVAVIIGVTIPLVAFRWLCPDEVFPVTYRRGRTAHLDVGGRRSRLVVSTVTSAPDRSSACATSAAPSRTCSQLSRQTSMRRSQSCTANDSSRPCTGSTSTPIVAAATSATWAGSVTASSSTHHTPSGHRAA